MHGVLKLYRILLWVGLVLSRAEILYKISADFTDVFGEYLRLVLLCLARVMRGLFIGGFFSPTGVEL